MEPARDSDICSLLHPWTWQAQLVPLPFCSPTVLQAQLHEGLSNPWTGLFPKLPFFSSSNTKHIVLLYYFFLKHSHVTFILGIRCQFNFWKSNDVIHHIKRQKKKNHMTKSTDREKNIFEKLPHPFIVIDTTKLGIQCNSLNLEEDM